MNALGILSSGENFSTGRGEGILQNARKSQEEMKFKALLQSITESEKSEDKTVSGVSSSQISGNRLNGDYTRGFKGAFKSEADKHALPSGAAANSYNGKEKRTIDKTSSLYEQALEMENYFVKIMLTSMRNTIQKSDLFGNENSYARNMYEDMLYDNYAEELTKKANFGIADQIYLQLDKKA